jgi:hypothetical protein
VGPTVLRRGRWVGGDAKSRTPKLVFCCVGIRREDPSPTVPPAGGDTRPRPLRPAPAAAPPQIAAYEALRSPPPPPPPTAADGAPPPPLPPPIPVPMPLDAAVSAALELLSEEPPGPARAALLHSALVVVARLQGELGLDLAALAKAPGMSPVRARAGRGCLGRGRGPTARGGGRMPLGPFVGGAQEGWPGGRRARAVWVLPFAACPKIAPTPPSHTHTPS